MAAKKSMKYGAAAVAIALGLIALGVVANPYLANEIKSGGTSTQQTGNFLILLTDPPNVPAGTTQLNITYTGVSVHATLPNGSSSWVPTTASGSVNLLDLVNVSQTIGSAVIPAGSTVDRIQFSISSASAVVSGVSHTVTILSNQLVVPIKGQPINGTQSAALLDLRPTLIQVDSTNSTGGAVSYYVLVPSATAVIKGNVSDDNEQTGSRQQLDNNDQSDLTDAQHGGLANVTIGSSSIKTSGNTTTFSVTLKNQGTENATIFGLTLHGNFSATSFPASVCTQTSTTTTTTTSVSTTVVTTTSTSTSHGSEKEPGDGQGKNNTSSQHGNDFGQGCKSNGNHPDHPDTVPFKVNGTSLVPLFGDGNDQGAGSALTTLKPGQSITLTYSGVIGLKTDQSQHGQTQVIGAITDDIYNVRLDGEGFQSANVTAG